MDDTTGNNTESTGLSPSGNTQEVNLKELEATSEASSSNDDSNLPEKRKAVSSKDFGAVYNVPVQVSAILGHTVMPVNQLLKLGRGAIIELDRQIGEPIDIYVNNRLVARGEVVLVQDRLGITMTEIIRGD